MKYNININQLGLADDTEITLSEASVIDWIHTFCGANNYKINKSKVDGWTWLSCQYLIDDMPLLRIKTRSGGRKLLNRLEALGYIEIKKEPKKLFIKPTPKLDTLYTNSGYAKKKDVSVSIPNCSPQDTYHNTNSNTNNNTDTEEIITSKVTLPLQKGKTPRDRVLSVYSALYKNLYKVVYKINFGRDYKIVNSLLELYTEVQLARLLVIYFNWRGMSGTYEKEFIYLSGILFPLAMFKSKVNEFEVYSRNVLGDKLDDDNEILKVVGSHMSSL